MSQEDERLLEDMVFVCSLHNSTSTGNKMQGFVLLGLSYRQKEDRDKPGNGIL